MKEFIELDGKKYRVEFNWNTITEYCEIKNIEDLSALDSLKNLSASDLRLFIYCALKEGERMEGKEFLVSVLDLGGILKFQDIQHLMQVFKKQSSFTLDSKEPPGDVKKKRMKFF